MSEYTNKTTFDYHNRQIKNPYESTKALVEFIETNISNTEEFSVLDVACGGGSNLIEFNKKKLFKNYLGVDISEAAINLGKQYIKKNDLKHIDFKIGNFYELEKNFNNNEFDLVTIIHTLFAIDDPFCLLEKLLSISKKYILINSLFTYDHVFIKTKSYDLDNLNQELNWNIIPFCKLDEFLNKYDAKVLAVKDFVMPFDLEKKSKGLRSYTKQLLDGSRLTFTSQIFLPWKFVLIEKE